jgi:hypothetical protein
MKHDEKESEKQWKMMKKREQTMKHDKTERKKQWKMMKKRRKNNEQW